MQNRDLQPWALFLISLAFFLGMSACSAPAGGTDAAAAVESYFQAIVDQDAAKLATLSCGTFEETALLEMDAFVGVEATLEGVACTVVDSDDSQATVTCAGKISASYGGELREFPLSERVFSLVPESGTWLICGME